MKETDLKKFMEDNYDYMNFDDLPLVKSLLTDKNNKIEALESKIFKLEEIINKLKQEANEK